MVKASDDEPRRGGLSRLAAAVTGRVVEAIDPDAVIGHIDVDHVVERIDLNRALDKVDIERLVGRVDVDDLLARVDINAVLERVDVNRLLDEVDVDRLLESVDVDRLLDRVDMNRLLDRVDVDRLAERLDLEALVARAGIPELVAESTGHVAGSVLDVMRRQLVGLDLVLDRVVNRALRRDPAAQPTGPSLLTQGSPMSRTGRVGVSGHYAGAASRSLAAVIDAAAISGLFTLGIGGIDLLVRVLGGVAPDLSWITGAAAFGVWAFLYVFVSLLVIGRTLGKAVIGLRVVAEDGSTLTGGKALARTLAFPLSALILGVGFLFILFHREHRALHDLIAATAVVYDWGEREAEVPVPLTRFLERRSVDPGQM